MEMESKIMNEFSNVDADEIRKFDRLAKTWWDPDGAMGMLHVINPLRTNFIKKNASLKGKKVLDVGCGGGILTESLAREGAEATGIDLAETPLKIASQHAEQAGLSIEYLAKNVEDLARERPHAYDVVACCEALEHVPDPGKIIDCCAALLKPGGTLFFSTINRNLKSFLFAIIGAEYVLRMLPRGTHHYSKLIKPQEIDQWAGANGFSLADVSSFMYNPFTKTFKLKSRADVNYITCYKPR
jgi:2-polyprenyl-6-hydroxyphenyl methylase/3-demethylubiquinone-9 3-methyltransferase